MATNPDEGFLFEPTASLPVLRDSYLPDDDPQYRPLRLALAGAGMGIQALRNYPEERTPRDTLYEQLAEAKTAVTGVLSRAHDALAASDRSLAVQDERVRELEAELCARDERLDELAREKQTSQDWESQARIAETAREGLEEELLRSNAAIAELAADRDALARQLAEGQSHREEQDVLLCEFQDQLRAKDDELARLEARMAQLAPGDAEAHATRLELDEATFGVLVRIDGDREIDYAIGEAPVTIGRKSDNTIQVRESLISRYHAQLVRRGTDTCIEDLGSTNGIFVNGLRETRKKLEHGDQISIGVTEFRYDANPPT